MAVSSPELKGLAAGEFAMGMPLETPATLARYREAAVSAQDHALTNDAPDAENRVVPFFVRPDFGKSMNPAGYFFSPCPPAALTMSER
jgi:hypothetical protein